MFVTLSGTHIFAVIEGTYHKKLSIKENRKQAITDANLRHPDMNGNGHYIIPDENFLIIWKEKEPSLKPYTGHSLDLLLHSFSHYIKSSMEDEAHQPSLNPCVYIESPKILCIDGAYNFETVMKRIIILFEGCSHVPFFLEDNFFETMTLDEFPPAIKMAVNGQLNEIGFVKESDDSMTTTIKEGFRNYVTDTLEIDTINAMYKTMFHSLKNLMLLFHYEFPDESDSTFIEQYFRYQKGEAKVKDCVASLDGISAPSFYRYIQEFESSPYYMEYLNCYKYYLDGSMRHGTMPDAIDFLLCFHECELLAEKEGKDISSYYAYITNRFSDIYFESEVMRFKAASDNKIKTLKKKGLYKEALEERGISESDLF